MKKYFAGILIISIILSCGCFDAEAEKEHSYDCDSILDGDSKDLCYIIKAIAKNDVYSCDKINNYYKEECYTFIAVEKKDLSICNNILTQDKKDLCYSGVGIARKDARVCTRIQSTVWSEWCYVEITGEKRNE